MNRKKQINFIITGALIAAAYVGLTFLSNVFNLAYGPIQLRVSEVLALLPIFSPAAIPGLAVGCFLANIASFNPVDMIFGTMATVVAAICTYYLRNIRFKGLPLLAMLPPVVINAVIIGIEISLFFMPETSFWWGFLISSLQVGLGELIVCYVFGIPFYYVIKKYNFFDGKNNCTKS